MHRQGACSHATLDILRYMHLPGHWMPLDLASVPVKPVPGPEGTDLSILWKGVSRKAGADVGVQDKQG